MTKPPHAEHLPMNSHFLCTRSRWRPPQAEDQGCEEDAQRRTYRRVLDRFRADSYFYQIIYLIPQLVVVLIDILVFADSGSWPRVGPPTTRTGTSLAARNPRRRTGDWECGGRDSIDRCRVETSCSGSFAPGGGTRASHDGLSVTEFQPISTHIQPILVTISCTKSSLSTLFFWK